MSTDVICRRLVVRGHVQGVFFRDSCREQAEAAGVSGWAANLPDGTVEVVLEGEPGDVRRLENWCREGTSSSRVEDVEVSEQSPKGLEGFEVS